MTHRETIEYLGTVWSSTVAACRDLDEPAWNLATDCPGWTVRDQLARVLGTEKSLAGHDVPGPASDQSIVHNDLGAINQAWVESFRSVPGSELLAHFDATTRQRLQMLRALTDDQLSAVIDTPIGRMSYGEFLRVRLMDSWVHEQDIRTVLDRPGDLDSPAAGAAVDLLLQPLGYIIAKRVRPRDGAVLRLDLHGPVSRRRAVEFSGGQGRQVEPTQEVSAAVATDAATFVRLAAGRWTASHALAEGSIECRGDRALAHALLENLATTP